MLYSHVSLKIPSSFLSFNICRMIFYRREHIPVKIVTATPSAMSTDFMPGNTHVVLPTGLAWKQQQKSLFKFYVSTKIQLIFLSNAFLNDQYILVWKNECFINQCNIFGYSLKRNANY